MEQLLRPYGIVIDGRLELGLELTLADGAIREIRPHTGIPDSYVISSAFVNAHSHLEYRGLQGKLKEAEYWPWIREITLAKKEQRPEDVQNDCHRAARENRDSGVAILAEHSDRPFSGVAMVRSHLRGAIFQETITRFGNPGAISRAEAAARAHPAEIPTYLIPHAYQTVDVETLRRFGASGEPLSMHVAETDSENQLTLNGSGLIAETFRDLGVTYSPSGKRLIPTLDDLGLVRTRAQFVHCCAIDESEVALLAERGVTVAHCPRSNVRLACPPAPVREMLDAGILVGLGLDSPASSGPIDMFAEMRAALEVSIQRGRPVHAEEVWRMATDIGSESLRFAVSDLPNWRIEPGSTVPLLKLYIGDAYATEDLIERTHPNLVEWVA